ncbi:hypothetical protein [Chryseobacterium shigense]|uniref:Knr4/Smi1-like domain-containing protein n=1 Tax=Chryseobacterium shigense TaxID=297244 RepID=A0A841NL49_9FLAO|nr:hypothetical protein [Chryseobacterium shigense]MBB6371505.1 hypothetical protein [Chryseobacterium shigense]
MNIQYLTQVKENHQLRNFVNRGFSLDKIKQIEQKFNNNKEFPKAFREFLFLAGDFNNFGFDDIDGIIKLQEYAKEDMEMAGQTLNKAFFAFDVLDSMYSVILLDETNEDPKVYLLMPFLAKGGSEPLLKPNGWDFTALVNESIRRVKNNISF